MEHRRCPGLAGLPCGQGHSGPRATEFLRHNVHLRTQGSASLSILSCLQHGLTQNLIDGRTKRQNSLMREPEREHTMSLSCYLSVVVLDLKNNL